MDKKLASMVAIATVLLSLVALVPLPQGRSFLANPIVTTGNEAVLAKIASSLQGLATVGGSQLVKVSIATTNPNEVYGVLGNYENLGRMGNAPAIVGKLISLVLDAPADSLIKVASLSSVAYVMNYALPEPIPPPDEDLPQNVEPNTWYAIETHGARAAWDLGYTGAGVNVAIIDTGIDFAHPDLQGRQAREPFGPYAGWPIAFDSRSMLTYLFSGGMAFPYTDVWYSDTSSTDTTGYVVTGTSKSGVYHIGLHPDDTLAAYWYGEYVAVLVVDEHTPGVYDTVYVDLNDNRDFTDDKPCFKGDELSWWDYTGDGLADVSGGMIYFIADGTLGVPYSEVISSAYGVPNVIPPAGSLVAFMINDVTENGGDHATLCASAVAAQGIITATVPGGATVPVVRGMAKDAKIIAVGNFYQGGNAYDDYYFVAEGYDGIPGTGDEANLVSMSFGTSGIVNDGWDYEARFIDYVSTFYNPYVTFLSSTGNGGHGYGTITSPSSASSVISVGASTEYWGFESIAGTDQITSGDVQPWSNRGPSAVGLAKPDVVAIGAWGSGDIPLNEWGDGATAWAIWGGTSMSCPAAAGVTALMVQAYKGTHGALPNAVQAKEIMMSSATNLNYDPLVQGAGQVNGLRAVQMASKSGGIIVSPSAWTAGDFDGKEYPAFAKILYPGDYDSELLTLTSTAPMKPPKSIFTQVKLSDSILKKVGEYTISFTADRAKESSYSAYRPDYLWDITKYIPAGTNLIKAFAYLPLNKLDPTGTYISTNNNGYRLYIYDWKDLNGNGKYWTDTNGNGVVNIGEMDSLEYNRFTYGYPLATALEARVHDPLSRIHNGLLVGIVHRDRTSLAPIVPITIKIEFYKKVDWDWLTVLPGYAIVPNGYSIKVIALLKVPKNAAPGVYEGTINLNYGSYETVVPVIVNVASSKATFKFGGTPAANTLYDNGRVFGGFDWRWRYEAGDWRFYFANIPKKEVYPGTQLLVDLKWNTLPTDIDAFIYGPQSDVFSSIWPDYYGPYTLGFKGGSVNTLDGGGIFRFQTSTGGAEEVISGQAVPGLNMIALHNVLYNDTSGEPFTGKVGTFTVNPYPVSISTSTNTGTQAMSVVSTLDLIGLTAMAFGLSQPEHLTGQTIYQDNPANPMTSSWTKQYILTNAGLFEVNLHVGANDLDLYILYDKDNDGIPDSNEIIAQSTQSAGIDEYIKITLPQDGKYWIFVHGWAVSPSPSLFDIDINIIQGNMLTVSGLPLGSIPAGTTVNFNLNYNLDGLAAGTWNGLVFVGPTNAPTAVSVPVEITYTP
jgi:subtilisin family serine protease